MLGTVIYKVLFHIRYVSVFLRQLHLCPSDRRTISLGVGLSGRQQPSVGVVLFVVSSLLRHRTSSLYVIIRFPFKLN